MIACRRLFFIFLLAASLVFNASQGWAETRIILKDGREIKVQNFWREGGMVKYQSYGGIVGIRAEDVDRIITPDMVSFDEAQKMDTIDAYEQFLKKYPQSSLAAQASDRISALIFEDVKRINSAQVYIDYIRRNPSSTYLQEAKERAEVLVFQDVVISGQSNKFMEYLEIYPDGRFARAARKAVEVLKYDAIKQSSNISDIETYLHEYPQSTYRKVLETRLARLVSESEAKAKAKQEEELRTRKLQELEAKKRHRFWIILFSILGVLVLSAAAAVLFFRERIEKMVAWLRGAWKAKGAKDAGEKKSKGAEPKTSFKQEPPRYEDLISTPQDRDPLTSPDSEKTRALEQGTPFSLPGPDGETGAFSADDETDLLRDEAGNFSLGEEETAIPVGYKEEGEPGGDSSPYERMIDLSDHETDFSLELEDVHDEAGGEETSPKETKKI